MRVTFDYLSPRPSQQVKNAFFSISCHTSYLYFINTTGYYSNMYQIFAATALCALAQKYMGGLGMRRNITIGA